MAEKYLYPVFAKRKILPYFFFGFLAVLIVVRLAFLQIDNYEDLQAKALDEITVESTTPAERGDIYDRDMNTLATSVTSWRVFISPLDIVRLEKETKTESFFYSVLGEFSLQETERFASPSEKIIKGLSEILDVKEEKVRSLVAKTHRRDETVRNYVDEEMKDKVLEFIEENGFSNCVHCEAVSKRYYGGGSLAANALGFTGTEGKGLYGLELQYDTEMTGTEGRYIYARDATGREMPYDYEVYIEPEKGLSLVTTIDSTIQRWLEEQLAETFEDSMPTNRAAGMVMNVKTGDVYAMAVAPSFDLNDPYVLNDYYSAILSNSEYEEGTEEYSEEKSKLLLEMWSNKNISELYEPGSTFKILTCSMALEDGVCSLSDQFYCPGFYKVPGFSTPIKCHRTYGHGDMTFMTGLQKSCNPCLMMIAGKIGSTRFYDYMESFGYFERTGVDLPGEAETYFFSRDGLGPVELAVASFGQRFKVTMIRQLAAIASVANGGTLVTPHLVSSLIDEDGKVVSSYEDEKVRQVISKDTAKKITETLVGSVYVEGGNGNAYVKGYRIAAKTGTSEKFEILDENGQSYLRIGSTVAYGPEEDPEIAVIMIVDEPQCSNKYGSNVAAPYVSRLLSKVFPYLGIEPTYTAEELETLELNVGTYMGLDVETARKNAVMAGLVCEVVGDGKIVTSQMPSAGTAVTKGYGRVVLYTDNQTGKNTVSVPNVEGHTAAGANSALTNAGLSVCIIGGDPAQSGTTYVYSQSIPAGTMVQRGTVVEIEIRHTGLTD